MEPTSNKARSKSILWLAIFIVLVTVRVPFLLTHHFLDDSFITFRTAVNLAEHRVYSYNLTTQAPGTTSVLYALLISLVRFVFRMHFLYPIGVLNSCLVVLASWFMARAFLDSAGSQRAFWIATATAPTGLLLSYLGMGDLGDGPEDYRLVWRRLNAGNDPNLRITSYKDSLLEFWVWHV